MAGGSPALGKNLNLYDQQAFVPPYLKAHLGPDLVLELPICALVYHKAEVPTTSDIHCAYVQQRQRMKRNQVLGVHAIAGLCQPWSCKAGGSHSSTAKDLGNRGASAGLN